MKHATILNLRLLPPDIKTIIMLLVPYDEGMHYSDGVSAYAHVLDYHIFFSEMFKRILPQLQAMFPEESFYGFSDHSPIAEKDAAAKSGLGIIGCNSLLINPLYGSYVFLGSILTTLSIDCTFHEIKYCQNCTQCKKSCPANAITDTGIDPSKCLSAISQKKRITEKEFDSLREHRIAWGCDICQQACPLNANRLPTAIPLFTEHRHESFNADEVAAMSEIAFSRYAFSWRGKKRIVQNLQNLVVR